MLDHLVYAVPDLDEAIEALAERLGVRPARGGSHPGGGTHNALLALGDDRYLELIAPDPAHAPPSGPRSFNLDRAPGPQLRTWALKAPDIEARIEAARAAGYDPGPAEAGSRARPDGTLLEWRLTRSGRMAGDGLVPFLIDWGRAAHPARSAPSGCTLVSLRAEHPDPPSVERLLAAIGVALDVTLGVEPALIAALDTPNGRVELR